MTELLSRRRFLRHLTLASGATLLGPAAGQAAKGKPRRKAAALGQNAERREAEYEATARLPVYKASIDPHWFDNGASFWYRNDGPGGRVEFVRVDAEQGVRAAAFNHAKLAAGLAKATGRAVEAEYLPFETIHYTDDGKAVQFKTAEDQWQCDLTTYVCTKLPLGTIQPQKPTQDKPEEPKRPEAIR